MSGYSKCPNCGGSVVFLPGTEKIKCSQCGSYFDIKKGTGSIVKRKYGENMSFENNKQKEETYSCPSCGSKMVVGANQTVSRCSSCGNVGLKKERSATFVPDGILPFKITREKAVEIFQKWIRTRKFIPNDLANMARLQKVIGFYTPVWNFDFTARCSYSAIGVKIETDNDGNKHYFNTPIRSEFSKQYEDLCVSGSTRISTRTIEKLSPYDYDNLKIYSPDYILGFAGLDTTVSILEAYNEICGIVSSNNEFDAKNKISSNYDEIEHFHSTTSFDNITFNYAYLPIWANHYTYKGKEYHCYINGQTGKVTGKSPKSPLKILGLIGGIALGIGIIALIIALV